MLNPFYLKLRYNIQTPKLGIWVNKLNKSWKYQSLQLIIIGFALYTLVLGLSWLDTWKLINTNLYRAYISACNNGFMGDLEDFITYLYQNDLLESGIITCVIMLALIIVIEFLKDTLKLIDSLWIRCNSMLRTNNLQSFLYEEKM